MVKHHVIIRERFEFEAGGSIPELEITYHTSPREYRKGEYVIWICHALTANSDPEEWWPGMVGPGKALDPEKQFIVCANILGSPYGTSGPSSINPATGEPYYFEFPRFTVRDIARQCSILRRILGIESIDLLIGSSVGGFYAMEWNMLEPEVAKHTILMATSARVTPFLTALNECQRMALKADGTFLEHKNIKGGQAGLRCARAIALTGYRSREGYNSTQAENGPETVFAERAASYQRHQGKKLSERFDAYSYWYLTNVIDSHNVGRGRGGVSKALGSIRSDVTFIAIDSDVMFPPEEMEHISGMVPGSHFHLIGSRFGHDGFLLENDQIQEILKFLVKFAGDNNF